MKNYYEILNVKKDASQEEIKKAYKKLAKKLHPDVSKEKNSEEEFKIVTEAYTVLSDERRRQIYDYQHVNRNPSNLSDILNTFFSGSNPSFMRESDVSVKMNINIFEFFHGTKKKVIFKRVLNNMSKEEISVNLEIPSGHSVENLKFTFKEKGNQKKDGSFSHLHIHVSIEGVGQFFMPRGCDVYQNIPIPLKYILSGEETEIPTLHGIKKVSFKDWYVDKKPLVLKDCGLRVGVGQDKFGKHIINPRIEMPVSLDEEIVKMFREIKFDEDKYPGYKKVINNFR